MHVSCPPGFALCALHCSLGGKKDIWHEKQCQYAGGDELTGALHILEFQTYATSVICCCGKIQDDLTFWCQLRMS